MILFPLWHKDHDAHLSNKAPDGVPWSPSFLLPLPSQAFHNLLYFLPPYIAKSPKFTSFSLTSLFLQASSYFWILQSHLPLKMSLFPYFHINYPEFPTSGTNNIGSFPLLLRKFLLPWPPLQWLLQEPQISIDILPSSSKSSTCHCGLSFYTLLASLHKEYTSQGVQCRI